MSSLFEMLKKDQGGLMGVASSRETTEATPTELLQVETKLVEDEAALARAEDLVNGLPRGHEVFECSGCHFRKTGIRGGPEHDSYRSHIKRHAHAGAQRFTAARG